MAVWWIFDLLLVFFYFRIQDVSQAEDNFNLARSYSQQFAFVHIAHAQFEHSRGTEMCCSPYSCCSSLSLLKFSLFLWYFILLGNTKRGIHILQNAIDVGAKPKDQLEAALQSIQTGKPLFFSEDKENVPCEYLWIFNMLVFTRLVFINQ